MTLEEMEARKRQEEADERKRQRREAGMTPEARAEIRRRMKIGSVNGHAGQAKKKEEAETEEAEAELEVEMAMAVGKAIPTDNGDEPLRKARTGMVVTAREVAYVARQNTAAALRRIVDLMHGRGGKQRVINRRDGKMMIVDIEVPAAVQMRCAEIIMERGYGKAPQAIFVASESLPGGSETLTIAEKILALQAARAEKEDTRDLEASEVKEMGETKAEEVVVPMVIASAPSVGATGQ